MALLLAVFNLESFLRLNDLSSRDNEAFEQRKDKKGRKGSSCDKTLRHPMFAFYMWLMLDLLTNILWLLLSIKMREDPMPLVMYLPATFKILVGTEQIWHMLELII